MPDLLSLCTCELTSLFVCACVAGIFQFLVSGLVCVILLPTAIRSHLPAEKRGGYCNSFLCSELFVVGWKEKGNSGRYAAGLAEDATQI